MKEKMVLTGAGEQCFQVVLPLGCWKPENCKKHGAKGRWLTRYQKQIDTVLAGIAIGLMFLTGIWAFLVQLAEQLR